MYGVEKQGGVAHVAPRVAFLVGGMMLHAVGVLAAVPPPFATLGRCVDPSPTALIECGSLKDPKMDSIRMSGFQWNRVQRLCFGIRQLQSSTCAQLSNHSFVMGAIQAIGLTFDMRKADLYGVAASSMIRTSDPNTKIGLWQDPSQFAAALMQHASGAHEVRRYLEIGCYTAWSALVLVSYLQRAGHRVRGVVVDLVDTFIGPAFPLLAGRGLSFFNRSAFSPEGALARISAEVHEARHEGGGGGGGGGSRRFDLCFIDAQHSYLGVKADYTEMAAHCRSAMFHDIQDMSTLHLGNFTGGVPAFWHHLARLAHPSRVTQFVTQLSTARPVFGLGILGPNRRGNVEPDEEGANWPEWGEPARGGKEAFVGAFCAPPEGEIFERICAELRRELRHRRQGWRGRLAR